MTAPLRTTLSVGHFLGLRAPVPFARRADKTPRWRLAPVRVFSLSRHAAGIVADVRDRPPYHLPPRGTRTAYARTSFHPTASATQPVTPSLDGRRQATRHGRGTSNKRRQNSCLIPTYHARVAGPAWDCILCAHLFLYTSTFAIACHHSTPHDSGAPLGHGRAPGLPFSPLVLQNPGKAEDGLPPPWAGGWARRAPPFRPAWL